MTDPVRKNKIVLTYDDYLSLPNDRNRYEILEGELIVTPSPTTMHQKVSRNLGFSLFSFIKKAGCGEVLSAPIDVNLDNSTIVQPDIIFISRDRLQIISERGIDGAPDLIVEVLSPSTVKYDTISKMQLYARYGVRWYWIVNPEQRTIQEYENRGDSFELVATQTGNFGFRPKAPAGLEINLAEIWE